MWLKVHAGAAPRGAQLLSSTDSRARRTRFSTLQLSFVVYIAMATGTAPDATSLVTFRGAPTTDAAIKSILHHEDAVRMAPEHWLVRLWPVLWLPLATLAVNNQKCRRDSRG